MPSNFRYPIKSILPEPNLSAEGIIDTVRSIEKQTGWRYSQVNREMAGQKWGQLLFLIMFVEHSVFDETKIK